MFLSGKFLASVVSSQSATDFLFFYPKLTFDDGGAGLLSAVSVTGHNKWLDVVWRLQ